MNEGVAICVDVDESRIDRRIAKRYLDVKARISTTHWPLRSRREMQEGLVHRSGRQRRGDLPCVARARCTDRHRHRPDLVARPLSYLPIGIELEDMKKMAEKDPAYFTEQAQESMASRSRRWSGSRQGRRGLRLRQLDPRRGPKAGYDRAFDFPGFVPAYIRPQFEEGSDRSAGPPFLATPRTSRPPTRPSSSCSRQRALAAMDHHGRRARGVRGLPARICWLGYGERTLPV